jgi:hypothetical protein
LQEVRGARARLGRLLTLVGRWVAGAALVGCVFAGVAAAADRPMWAPWVGRPDVGLEDIYKAFHQAWRGPGHMIPSRAVAADYLEREWKTLGSAMEGERLLDTLASGAPFLRLNLRPFRDAGGVPDSLLEAFLHSAGAPVDSAAFAAAWEKVGAACGNGAIPFPRAAFDSIDGPMREAGYPAIHHSAAYAARYRPAYRVLSRGEAERLAKSLSNAGKTH